ncbi:cytochrome c oxidase subunit NDUFA4L [Hypomesus transpacificus]|uniref:cytochrome c oxidase subunit NDUFA4L n=1 Tax=Hypomesus transpacificus TaxID=137520 RepID=UPI001F07828B|nr:cytochrome c oxidase subunit NDUFA4L [Hypomesus transpacificus]
MLGTVSKQLKSHPALIPLFFFIGGGALMSMMYLARLGMGPHVCWDRKNNPEPWNKMSATDQYKFFTVNMDYAKLKKNGPDF